MTSPSTPGLRTAGERAKEFRRTYLLNVALVAYAGSKGALSDACDTAERAYAALLDRIEELEGALDAMRTWLGVVADEIDIDPDTTAIVISAVGPTGSREVARRTLRSIYEQADNVLGARAAFGGSDDR